MYNVKGEPQSSIDLTKIPAPFIHVTLGKSLNFSFCPTFLSCEIGIIAVAQ